jgi:hypothetical protein
MRGLNVGTEIRTKCGVNGLSDKTGNLVPFDESYGVVVEVDGYGEPTYLCRLVVSDSFRRKYGRNFWFVREELVQKYHTR